MSEGHLLVWWMRVTNLRDVLESKFPDELDFVSAKTSISGSFEVKVKGKLVHSKKTGNGFVDSEDKMGVIVRAIEQARKN
ncbi:hypothetical protein SKAU_G00323420 [Synaphobranchus kaupii]|uniref:Selenoprotein W n=1 Tax=Synaphobranchus kaupii TaxID=118154 RepID=A0A9Q1EP83_SYNKA|nr:hypothetical protein SKAU_G00323420 [Synaphobranchus kaupii]